MNNHTILIGNMARLCHKPPWPNNRWHFIPTKISINIDRNCFSGYGPLQKRQHLIAQAGSRCSSCRPRSCHRFATLVIQKLSCPLNDNCWWTHASHATSKWNLAYHHSGQSFRTMEHHFPIPGSSHPHQATCCVRRSTWATHCPRLLYCAIGCLFLESSTNTWVSQMCTWYPSLVIPTNEKNHSDLLMESFNRGTVVITQAPFKLIELPCLVFNSNVIWPPRWSWEMHQTNLTRILSFHDRIVHK